MCKHDYTPRKFDAVRRRLVIAFALHEKGPATRWASYAAPGDVL
ncbi:siderophore-interacting protein [Ochrobactrum quorumnocens]